MPVEVTTSKPIKRPRTRKALMDLAQSLTKESHIEQTCSEWLELDGWRTLKTDPVSDRSRGKGFGEVGMADRLYLRYNEGERLDPVSVLVSRVTRLHGVMWIEWKSAKGRAQQHQKDWHYAERLRGALALVAGEDFAPSIESFQAWYRRSGLMRRKI